MKLTKTDHLKRIEMLENPLYDHEREDIQYGYYQLFENYYNNPALNSNDLKHTDVVYDKKIHEWIMIEKVEYVNSECLITYWQFGSNRLSKDKYLKNRFYRKKCLK